MATNYLQPGDHLTLTAPTGGVLVGVPILIGGLFVVPTATAAATVSFVGTTCGVWSFTKTASEVWTEGQAIFWDVTNSKVSNDPAVGLLPIGSAAAAAASADANGSVRLLGLPVGGRMINLRRRIAVATVSTGTTVLPAIPGMKYRMISATAISIGGATTTVTTVDILGTVSTSRKLVAFAQASLTQSAVLKDGGTGAAVLADGASYTANDANTAVTVGITGSAITVATSIDFNIVFQIE